VHRVSPGQEGFSRIMTSIEIDIVEVEYVELVGSKPELLVLIDRGTRLR
jgi:hypothetical protein